MKILNLVVSLLILGVTCFILYKVSSIQSEKQLDTLAPTVMDTLEKGNKIDAAKLPSREKTILGEIELKVAEPWISSYRKEGLPTQTFAIYYDQNELKTYIDDNFIKHTEEVALPKNLSWKIAFNPMYTNVTGVTRLAICILPVIVDDKGIVYDYLDCKKEDNDYYKNYYKPLEEKVAASNLVSFIYDEGNLWP